MKLNRMGGEMRSPPEYHTMAVTVDYMHCTKCHRDVAVDVMPLWKDNRKWVCPDCGTEKVEWTRKRAEGGCGLIFVVDEIEVPECV